VYGFVDIPFADKRSRWEWLYSLAVGLSYNFNPYNPEENPLNIFIGSRRNVYINLYAKGQYHLSKRVMLGVGTGFTHFSNGAYRLPNRGLNMLPLLVSATYKLNKDEVQWKPFTKPEFKPSTFIDVYWGNGTKNYNKNERNYWKSSAGVAVLRQFSHKYRIGGGFDVFYSAGGTERVSGNSSNFKKNFSYAPYGAWEWCITERLYMPIYLGIYLHRNKQNDENEFFYQRIGLRYKFKNNVIGGVALKANAGAADFVEWTVGYSFKKGKK
jgi:Lipid A 3-O-deacylase (PagL)